MVLPIVPTLPPFPVRGEDRETFAAKANNHVAALPGWTTQVNALGTFVDAEAALAEEYAEKIGLEVEPGTFSAKEYATGDLTTSGGSSKAWAIDTESPNGTTEKSAKTLAGEASESAFNAAASAMSADEDATATASDRVQTGLDVISSGENADAAEASAASAASTSASLAENPATTTGLTWGWLAGQVRSDNIITDVAAGTIALTDNALNYVEYSEGMTVNQIGFTPGAIPIRALTVSAGVQIGSVDSRAWLIDPQAYSDTVTATQYSLSIENGILTRTEV